MNFGQTNICLTETDARRRDEMKSIQTDMVL